MVYKVCPQTTVTFLNGTKSYLSLNINYINIKAPNNASFQIMYPFRRNKKKPRPVSVISNESEDLTDALRVAVSALAAQQKSSIDSNSTRRSVRFRDEVANESDSVATLDISVDGSVTENSATTQPKNSGLVDVAYFETLMKDIEPWGDHNYLAGFRKIFSTDELWIKDVHCVPCGGTSKGCCYNTTFDVLHGTGRKFYTIQKSQNCFATTLKKLLFPRISRFRLGFTARLYNPESVLLLKFVRRTHAFATQLDIVESFYGTEESYVGRIERTMHGYILRDKDGIDIYRILKLPTNRSSFRRMSRWSMEVANALMTSGDLNFQQPNCCLCRCKSEAREMRIFRTDNKEVVGRVCYINRSKCMRCLTNFLNLRSSQIGFNCNPDLGCNAKLLIIGALLFLMHSGRETFKKLPLGSDAFGHKEDSVLYESSHVSLELVSES